MSQEFPYHYDKQSCPDCEERGEDKRLFMARDKKSVQCEECGEVWDIERDEDSYEEEAVREAKKSQLDSISTEETIERLTEFKANPNILDDDDYSDEDMPTSPVMVASESEYDRALSKRISNRVMELVEKALEAAIDRLPKKEESEPQKVAEGLRNPFNEGIKQHKIFELLKEGPKTLEEVNVLGKKPLKESTLKKYIINDLGMFTDFKVVVKDDKYSLEER